MRWSISVVVVGLAALSAPRTAHAECPPFSLEGSACVTAKPKLQADFAKLAAANTQAQKLLAEEAQRAMAASVPTDCKMIKPVDPAFASKMPVQTPDPTIAFQIQTVPVPSCGKKKSDEGR